MIFTKHSSSDSLAFSPSLSTVFPLCEEAGRIQLITAPEPSVYGCQRMPAVISAWDQDERGGRTGPKMATSDSIPKAPRGEIIWTHRKREMMVSINSLKRRFNTLVNIPQTVGSTWAILF